MSTYNIATKTYTTYSRFNLGYDQSDITVFINEYRKRILAQLQNEEKNHIRFNEYKLGKLQDNAWHQDNQERFFKDSPNKVLKQEYFLSDMGYITALAYYHTEAYVIVGHSTGLIQQYTTPPLPKLNRRQVGNTKTSTKSSRSRKMNRSNQTFHDDEDDETQEILALFKHTLEEYYRNENEPKVWYPMFNTYNKRPMQKDFKWVDENYEKFLSNTPNKILQHRWYSHECGFITALAYTKDGDKIIVGHSNGLIQMRHGHTGTVLATLRNIQFPPKSIYAIEINYMEERICYAACTDGVVYRIEIPAIDTGGATPPEYCIRADPALEWLNTIFYGSGVQNLNAHPFISQRSPALSLSITADASKMIVGYADTSVKTFDLETQEMLDNFKVHKLRLQFIPKKLQRLHYGQVCAVRTHHDDPHCFVSAAWDNTFRVWDTRCKIGCMTTFEDVNICNDSIDLNRHEAITGSWTTTEGLSHWSLSAKKRISIVRVQNRRPGVDGEYIYACRYWKSSEFNRKGKYAIIGGSGTGCLEVINLHNRYITGSFPAPGTVLAVTSHDDRIAFGGTAPVFNIVTFHDPKHEPYLPDEEPAYDYSEHPVTLFETNLDRENLSTHGSSEFLGEMEEDDEDEQPEKDSKHPEKDSKHPEKDSKPVQSRLTDISKFPIKKTKIYTVSNLQRPPT